MSKRVKLALLASAATVVFAGCGGCGSNADTAADNISKEAEKFNVQRKIVGINGITDKPLFEVEGKCSIEKESLGLVVICKHGPKDFRKHYIGLSDNVTYVSTQLKGVAVSEYRTSFVLRPENLIPNIDLVTGQTGGRAEQSP